MLLDAERSQVIAIDIQERLLPAMAETRQLLERVDLLAAGARQMNVPVTISEQYPRGLGSTFGQVANAFGNRAETFEKVEFSVMRNAAIAEHVADCRNAGRNQVVVLGIETHVCVAQSVLDLHHQGYAVAVVADASSSRRDTDKEMALARFRAHGIEVVTTEMVVFEWLERAGTDDFRAMAPLIK